MSSSVLMPGTGVPSLTRLFPARCTPTKSPCCDRCMPCAERARRDTGQDWMKSTGRRAGKRANLFLCNEAHGAVEVARARKVQQQKGPLAVRADEDVEAAVLGAADEADAHVLGVRVVRDQRQVLGHQAARLQALHQQRQ